MFESPAVISQFVKATRSATSDEVAVAKFSEGRPFKFWWVENLFDYDELYAANMAFPKASWEHWQKSAGDLWCSDPTVIPAPCKALLRKITEQSFVDGVGDLTGIRGLIPFQKGLNLLPAANATKPRREPHDTRLTLTLFLNNITGGGMEFWDKRLNKAAYRLSAKFGRTIITENGTDNYIGATDPPHKDRKSIVVNYLTSEEI